MLDPFDRSALRVDAGTGDQRATDPQTSTTFPTQYVGRLVFRRILAELTDHARRERLELGVSTRPRLFCILLRVTVSGDMNAVERFNCRIDGILSRYSMTTGLS